MKYTATIKWKDTGEIQESMTLKVGEVEEDDDEIFFYMESKEEIESLKKGESEDWILVSIKEANEVLSARVVIEEDNEVAIYMSDDGVATLHHNGDHMLTTYYQDRCPEDDPKIWDKLSEGKAYIEDWEDKQDFDDEMILDAILWLGGSENSPIEKDTNITEFKVGDIVTLDRYNHIDDKETVEIIEIGRTLIGGRRTYIMKSGGVRIESTGGSIVESMIYSPAPLEDRHDKKKVREKYPTLE